MSYKLQVTSYKKSSHHHITASSNHLICFLLSAFCFLLLTPCAAQSKFGHVDYTAIITNMAGIDSIQNIVKNYSEDLQVIGEQMAKEFKEKQTAFEKLVNAQNSSQAILKIKQDELMGMYRRIQEFEQSAEADIQEKQFELLEPFQNKLKEAIKKVAKANNYNYVLDITMALFKSPNDDLTDKVKAELKMK